MKAQAASAKIRADLERHRHLFDLTRDGLGVALCKAATDGVQYAIAREESPDGTKWADLSPAYAEAKALSHPGNPISLLEGVMDNPREVAGEVVVSAEKATATYGVSDQARQEAIFFQEGNSNQPPRPFWGFTKESEAEARRILDERFKSV